MIESVSRTGGVNGAAQALMLVAMMQMMQGSNGPGGSQGQGSDSPIQMMLNLLSEMLKLAAQALKPQGQGDGEGGSAGPGGAQGPAGAQQAPGAEGSGELTPQTIMQLMQEIMKIMQKLMGGQQEQQNGSPFEATPQANNAANMLSGLADFLKGASDVLSGLSNLLGGPQGSGADMPGGAPGGTPGGTPGATPGGTPGGTPGAAPGGTPSGEPAAGPGKPTTEGPAETPFTGEVGKGPAGMPQDKWQLCVEAGQKTGQDPYVLAAMMEKESQFGKALNGNSPSSGDGLMQVEPSTRQAYAAKFQEKMGHAYDHSSEADQVAMAGVILADKGGSTTNKLQKYNGGDNWQPGATDSYGRVIEADKYAASVEARAREMRASGGV